MKAQATATAAKRTTIKARKVTAKAAAKALAPMPLIGDIKVGRSTVDKKLTQHIGVFDKSAKSMIRAYCGIGEVLKLAKIEAKANGWGWQKLLESNTHGIAYSTAARYIDMHDIGADLLVTQYEAAGMDKLNIKALMSDTKAATGKTDEKAKARALKGAQTKAAKVEPKAEQEPDAQPGEGLGTEMVNLSAAFARASDEELGLLAEALAQEINLRKPEVAKAIKDAICGKSVN